MISAIIEKMSEKKGSKISMKAEEILTGPIMTGGFFDYNLLAAFYFSDKSYANPRLKNSVNHIMTRFSLIDFMLETYEAHQSKKQFPMNDVIQYTMSNLSHSKKEVR